MIGGKLAPLILAEEEVETMKNNFNTAVTDTASKILGKHCQKNKSWVTGDLLAMCDKRRQLKKDKSTTEDATKCRVINNAIKRGMKRARENWIEEQCSEIEDNIKKNNSKRAFQIVNNLTKKTTKNQQHTGQGWGNAHIRKGVRWTVIDGQNTGQTTSQTESRAF